MWESLNVIIFDMLTSTILYKMEKKISINKKYTHNLSQSNYDPFANWTKAEIVFLLAINFDLLEY